jgi:regulator of extracellular matrix RemA (YlzA/DUF370 family)
MRQQEDRLVFDRFIQTFESEMFPGAAFITVDSSVRHQYSTQIRIMSRELTEQVLRHQITWAKAAEEAQIVRNSIMETMRNNSSPIGSALAESIKSQGKTMEVLIEEKTVALFGKDTTHAQLSAIQRDQVYAKIVESAGKSNPKINRLMMRLTHAGRALIILSVAYSVWEIATAEDKVTAVKREVVVTGAGLSGSIVGGAAAGLACAAPVRLFVLLWVHL